MCRSVWAWPFQGVSRFLRSMENAVTGLYWGGERVMCQATCEGEHVWMWHAQQSEDGWDEVIHARCHAVCDKAAMRDHWALSRSPLGGAGYINIYRASAILTSTDFKTPESHIIFYWNLCGGFKQSVTKHSAHTQQPDSKCFFYYCGAYNIDVEMESLFIHISFFLPLPYRPLRFSSRSQTCAHWCR